MATRLPSVSGAVPPRRGSRGVVAPLLWSVALAFVLYSLIRVALPENTLAPAAGKPGQAVSTPAAAGSSARPGLWMPRSAPTRLKIPRIQVDAPFTGLAIGPSGALDAPPADNTNLVGWHADGVSPGERGTAIIAGHVDTKTSPAVFAGLGELDPGDRFDVKRADGSTASFVVDTVESFAKDDFPSGRVYGDAENAQVRLITCAGDYDRQAKDYTENLVVFAHLDSAGAPEKRRD